MSWGYCIGMRRGGTSRSMGRVGKGVVAFDVARVFVNGFDTLMRKAWESRIFVGETFNFPIEESEEVRMRMRIRMGRRRRGGVESYAFDCRKCL